MTEHPDLDQMQDYMDNEFQNDLDEAMATLDRVGDILTGGSDMTSKREYTVDKSKWQEKLDEIDKSDGGIYVFPQVGRTRVRLLLAPESEPETFYHPVIRMFRGKEKTQYMAPCIVLGENDKWNMEVKYINMNKTVFKGVLTILAGGDYDLLSPTGHAIEIVRTGEGFNTQYSVVPSKDPIPVEYDQFVFEKALSEYAADLESSDRKDKQEEVKDDFSF